MKKTLTILLLAMTATVTRATLQPILYYSQTFSGGTIADGNPVGQAFSGVFDNAGVQDQVVDLTVGLNVTGGFNADLYAYLVAPNGTLVVLLDQPGVGVDGIGATGTGMNITLQGSGFNSSLTPGLVTSATQGLIQTVTSGSVLSGTYTAAGSFGGIGGPQLDPTGSAANGVWTLFFADLNSGGGNETLNSWTLNLAVVPEPVDLALGLFVTMLLALAGIKRLWVAKAITSKTEG